MSAPERVRCPKCDDRDDADGIPRRCRTDCDPGHCSPPEPGDCNACEGGWVAAAEPMAHHVWAPWTLGDSFRDSTEHRSAHIWLRAWDSVPLIETASRRVLVDADLLDPRVPPEWLADLLGLVADTPLLTWLLWTRQPEAYQDRLGDLFFGTTDPPANVWLGVRASDQDECDARIPELLAIPAALRWLWLDPLEGEVDLTDALCAYDRNGEPSGPRCNPDGSAALGWVVAQGGESPVHHAWVRSLRDQCAEAGVPFRFGGWGERDSHQGFGEGAEASGRLLDGRTHDDVPEGLL